MQILLATCSLIQLELYNLNLLRGLIFEKKKKSDEFKATKYEGVRE